MDGSSVSINHRTVTRCIAFSPSYSTRWHAVVALENGGFYKWDYKQKGAGLLDRYTLAHSGAILGMDWVGPNAGPEAQGWLCTGGMDKTVKVRPTLVCPSKANFDLRLAPYLGIDLGHVPRASRTEGAPCASHDGESEKSSLATRSRLRSGHCSSGARGIWPARGGWRRSRWRREDRNMGRSETVAAQVYP